MRFTDHSRTVTDWTCPRARYWGYEHEGRGVQPIEPVIELSFGDAIAKAAEAIRTGQPVPSYGGPLPWAALYQGLTEAYRTVVWPSWQQQFVLVHAEIECELVLSPDVTYQARPDAIVQRLSDQTYWYIQDKTTSLNPENFTKGWEKHPELHATALAVEKKLGLQLSGAYVQGWYKGYPKAGTLYSPLAYCWLKPGQPGISKPQPSFEYRAGWPRVAITEVGVEGWVKSLPVPLVLQQFPVTQAIMLRRDLAEAYLKQTLRRELDLKLWHEGTDSPEEHRSHFPQHFNQCDEWSKYRRPCSWRDCCWAPGVQRDPVGSGLYVIRQPHHEPEAKAL